MERRPLPEITVTKILCRVIVATKEPYEEWHLKGLKPVLDPEKCVVHEVEKF